MTYQSEDYLYIMVGYGLQNSGGYSIAVEGLTLAGEGICCETRLLGPDGGEELTTAVSYPYIVIKRSTGRSGFVPGVIKRGYAA